MNITPQWIKRALDRGLLGSESHKKMMPPYRKLHPSGTDKKKLKDSSVLLLLFQENGEIYTCLIKRPSTMKYHAGQVAFPGGKSEPGEKPLDTALRETWEEIGIHPDKIDVLGSLSEIFVEVSNFMIHPFVGWLTGKPTFTIHESEVEKIILFPLLKYKKAREFTDIETVSGKLTVPCFRFEGEMIWGATSMILSEFYDILE